MATIYTTLQVVQCVSLLTKCILIYMCIYIHMHTEKSCINKTVMVTVISHGKWDESIMFLSFFSFFFTIPKEICMIYALKFSKSKNTC